MIFGFSSLKRITNYYWSIAGIICSRCKNRTLVPFWPKSICVQSSGQALMLRVLRDGVPALDPPTPLFL